MITHTLLSGRGNATNLLFNALYQRTLPLNAPHRLREWSLWDNVFFLCGHGLFLLLIWRGLGHILAQLPFQPKLLHGLFVPRMKLQNVMRTEAFRSRVSRSQVESQNLCRRIVSYIYDEM